jgi:hypothetical protein
MSSTNTGRVSVDGALFSYDETFVYDGTGGTTVFQRWSAAIKQSVLHTYGQNSCIVFDSSIVLSPQQTADHQLLDEKTYYYMVIRLSGEPLTLAMSLSSRGVTSGRILIQSLETVFSHDEDKESTDGSSSDDFNDQPIWESESYDEHEVGNVVEQFNAEATLVINEHVSRPPHAQPGDLEGRFPMDDACSYVREANADLGALFANPPCDADLSQGEYFADMNMEYEVVGLFTFNADAVIVDAIADDTVIVDTVVEDATVVDTVAVDTVIVDTVDPYVGPCDAGLFPASATVDIVAVDTFVTTHVTFIGSETESGDKVYVRPYVGSTDNAAMSLVHPPTAVSVLSSTMGSTAAATDTNLQYPSVHNFDKAILEMSGLTVQFMDNHNSEVQSSTATAQPNSEAESSATSIQQSAC